MLCVGYPRKGDDASQRKYSDNLPPLRNLAMLWRRESRGGNECLQLILLVSIEGARETGKEPLLDRAALLSASPCRLQKRTGWCATNAWPEKLALYN